jgi:hypothetical protein
MRTNIGDVNMSDVNMSDVSANDVSVDGDVTMRLDLIRRLDAIGRLDEATTALAGVDLGDLSDAAIEESLSVLSIALCRVDLLLSRLASETRFREAGSTAFSWFDTSPAAIRRTDAEVARVDGLRLVG